YAGTYVYGRRQDDPRRKRAEQPRSGRVVMRRADWHAFLPDYAPAYISWVQYEANLARLEANRARAASLGAVRNGAALLAGLGRLCRGGARPHGPLPPVQRSSRPVHLRLHAAARELWRPSLPARRRAVPGCLCERAGARRARAGGAGVVLGRRRASRARTSRT